MGGGIRDAGKMFADALRSSIDITGRAINVIATRGGADEVVTVTQDTPSQDNTMWYALGAVGLVAVVVVAKKRKKR